MPSVLRNKGVIDMSTKPEQIHEALKHIDNKYSNINCGGCGVMATLIGEYLSNLTEIRIAVGVKECFSKELELSFDQIRHVLSDNVNTSVSDWYSHGISFNHVWVEFLWGNVWYSIDMQDMRKGTYGVDDVFIPYEGRLSLDNIKNLSNNITGWNTMFNRDQIPAIKHDIETKLKQVCSQ